MLIIYIRKQEFVITMLFY